MLDFSHSVAGVSMAKDAAGNYIYPGIASASSKMPPPLAGVSTSSHHNILYH
jgi:hypothetical protein